MEGEATSVAEAASDAATAVTQAAEIAAEHSAEVVAAVIEGAQQRVEAADNAAQQIAQAAVETNLGQRVAGVEQEFREWRDGEGQALRLQVDRLTAENAELRQQMAATATVAVVAAQNGAVPPLISAAPEPNLIQEAETLAAIVPEAMAPAPSANTQSAEPQRRRKVFL